MTNYFVEFLLLDFELSRDKKAILPGLKIFFRQHPNGIILGNFKNSKDRVWIKYEKRARNWTLAYGDGKWKQCEDEYIPILISKCKSFEYNYA